MKIGIDISQIAYSDTGVANFLGNLVENLLKIDKENEYILFFSSLRRNFQFSIFNFQSTPKNLKVKTFKIPPIVLDFIWNRLHIMPIELFIGDVDIFISSDWTQPPSKKAKLATILYDLIIYKYPSETDKKIIATQRRRLKWVKKEVDLVLCISEATKKDAREIFNIDKERLKIVYPGIL